MNHASSIFSTAEFAPWWAVPAATLAGVLITVAATVTLELLRARRERANRLFDARRESYSKIADLVRRQMSLLKEGRFTFEEDAEFTVPKESHDLHREAAILASLIGSVELVDAIDYQYQCTLETWTSMKRSHSRSRPLREIAKASVDDSANKAEAEALRVINIMRQDTGVAGDLRHQWF